VERPSRTVAALAGLIAAAVALAVAELLAGLNRSWRSPVLDVGDRVIDAAPPFVKEFAIDTFGTNDKPALLIGIAVILGLYAAAVGVVALRRNFYAGVAGIAVFGAIGAWAALSRRTSTPVHVALPSVGRRVVASPAGSAPPSHGRTSSCPRRPNRSSDCPPPSRPTSRG
jgi:ABC-type uncharacterized transport system permease subunit